MSDEKESKKIISTMSTAIMESLQKDVSLWADEMEQTYPTWKGSRTIKRSDSQYQRKLEAGFNNAHANKLEDGVPAKPITGEYVQKVKSHKRKGKRGATTVKAHTKTYKNSKPVQLRSGVWRVLTEMPKVKAEKIISKSVKSRYTGKNMNKLLAEAIKQAFK